MRIRLPIPSRPRTLRRQMSHLPFVFCTACRKQMPLPVPSPKEISKGLSPWPPDNWSAEILHLGCGRMFAYFSQDLRLQGQARTAVQDRAENPLVIRKWLRVRLKCVEEDSCTPATLFVCLTSAIAAQKLVSTIYEQPRVWRCPAGHPVVYGSVQQEEVFSLSLD